MVKEGQIQITKTNLGFFQDHALFKCKSVLFFFEAYFFFYCNNPYHCTFPACNKFWQLKLLKTTSLH